MLPDEKLPMAENEAPKEVEQVSGQAIEPKKVEQISEQAIEPAEDAPLTKEMFAAQMQRLIERARAAGLNPIETMARTYARRGMGILEGILTALENEDNSKKKKA